MIVYKPKGALIFRLRDPTKITSVIPSAKMVMVNGQECVAVPHRPDEVAVLNNLGYTDIPSPIRTYYNWPGRDPAFEVQKESAHFMTMHQRAYVLNGMGTAKTRTTLFAFDYLRSVKRAKRMLVVAPLSTLERAWGDEIFKCFPHLSFNVLHGTRDRRIQLLKQEVDIYVINHDGLKIILEDLAKRPDIDVFTIDELATVRNMDTDRWHSVRMVANGQKIPRRVWGLTGTPTPNGPTDAYAQCRIVNPTHPTMPKYFNEFQRRVMVQVSQYTWLPRSDAMDFVYSVMQPAIRYSLEDCLDLPEQMHETRDVDLTSEQKKAYGEMMRQLQIEAREGQITAANEAIKINKLVQICCGTVYGNEGQRVKFSAGPRLKVVEETVEAAEGKTIVFVPYTGALEHVAEYLRKRWTVATVSGETSKGDRDQIFADFQNRPEPKVIVANPGTMSHGLTLTAANTIIWYAPIHSNDIYEQACARVRRPGQKRTTVIVTIQSTPIEAKIYQKLRDKQRLQGELLELVREGVPA